MARFFLKLFIWVLPVMAQVLGCSVSGSSWCPQNPKADARFEQKTDRFWEFDKQSNTWVEIRLPFDLLSCVNGNCTKVGSIQQTKKSADILGGLTIPEPDGDFNLKSKEKSAAVESSNEVLPIRKRISLTKMSDASIWVTGESGSIYERFWNGVQWVIAPHDLPIPAWSAVSVFIVNQTILALSEAAILYQLQLFENSHPIWTEFVPAFEPSMHSSDTEPSSTVHIKSGILSHDEKRVYFTTKNGSLLELSEFQPLRWINHGRPPGGDVAAIADACTIRPDVVFTVSSTGDLYEFDKNSKPSWKKHIWSETSTEEVSLKPSRGCALHGLIGAHSQSLFLLTKGGNLMERRLHQRKWKWIDHKAPKGHHLSAITPVEQNELNEKIFSLFFTTASGIIFEYRLHKQSALYGKTGATFENQLQEPWVNHMHPPHARAARSISGLQLQVGRILFPLDDGRLAELHLSGIGGEGSGPTNQINLRRKASLKYEWSVLDAPETEGWNTEYCTEEHGPLNCIVGVKDMHGDDEANDLGIMSPTRRRKGQAYRSYLSPRDSGSSLSESTNQNNFITNSIHTNFRMRAMQAERSFFIITDGGLTFEYMYIENVWLWLRHEHSAVMKGVLGNYNGSLFLVDMQGNLLIRERSSNELSWINCTAMTKGRHVVSGPPWDGTPGLARRVTAEDAMFFVNKNGRLLQFSVALRKFKWKDCRSPPNTKIASIVDQEVFRMNIVFVIGRNGRLYQYNKLTELWHEHSQSPHLVLSRLPGTVSRLSLSSLTGSLFMFSEDGGLVEYHWNTVDGWNWVEHGTPNKNVTLVGAPGPCFEGNKLFMVGSDGNVYLRYLEQRTWQWKSCGFPHEENTDKKTEMRPQEKDGHNEDCTIDVMDTVVENARALYDQNSNCDEKVAPVRPIPFSEDSVIFELRDGRKHLIGIALYREIQIAGPAEILLSSRPIILLYKYSFPLHRLSPSFPRLLGFLSFFRVFQFSLSSLSLQKNQMAVSFSDLHTEAGIKSLDQFLAGKTYISGGQLTKDDIKVYGALVEKPSGGFANACRWYETVASHLAARFPGQAVGVRFAGQVSSAPAAPAVEVKKDAPEGDDDDDLDLFGDETEEEKKAAAEREAAVKASSKKKESGKSSVLLEVKPWDDETDMKKLEEAVRSVEMPGLLWGASKLVPVGYGIKKLVIMMTIEDDLVSVDNLIEDCLTAEPANEYIQSCDIVAFNKI